jgi:hypothetical protein
MPLDNVRLGVSFTGTLTSALDLVTASAPLAYALDKALGSGTGANQVDRIWHDKRTITASSTDSLDLAGVLTDPFGALITFARLKFLFVEADAANTNNVNVTRPATNGVPLFLAASDGIPVHPGGYFQWFAPTAAGVVVTAGTGDLIDMVNSAGGSSVIYNVVLLGASA